MPQLETDVTSKHSTPSPTYTCLPGLFGALQDSPTAVLRKCLTDLCKDSAADAKRVTKTLRDSNLKVLGSSAQDHHSEGNERNEDVDPVELLLQRALDTRKTFTSSRAFRLECRKYFDELDEIEERNNRREIDTTSNSSGDEIQLGLTSSFQRGDVLAVNHVGPSSYGYSNIPRCVQRNRKSLS
ncbi:MAG: hypothetical protein L6R41_003189 [Letrouitia leprolyta]|nr:MAG: hypothetical protein L6R41_003189 [Letrouitia leprolyta]